MNSNPRRASRYGCASLVAIAAVLAVATPARAQTSPPPETHAADLTISAAQGTSSAAASAAPTGQLRLPDSGARPESPIHDDAKFNAFILGGFITAAGADVAVTMYQIGSASARERGFGAWWQDSPVAFSVSKSAMTAVFVYGLQRVHRSRPKTAVALGIAGIAVESMLAVRAGRMGRNARPAR
jgi:hypothetical protein